MPRRKTKEEVLKEFKEAQSVAYNYELVTYTNNHTPVIIICPKHGKFSQTPRLHKRGSGCPKCSGSKKVSQHDIIQQFKDKHGDEYDYSKVQYVNTNTKVTIICRKHGEFEQTPYKHKSGQGCPKCAQKRKFSNKQLTTESIIKQFEDKHGDEYDYSKVQYVNTKTKVTIICPEHGEFLQTPSMHKRGARCPQCAGGITYNKEEIIKLFKDKHGDEYDYSKVQYVNSYTTVTIICPEHGEFKKQPRKHLIGQGCPYCIKSPKNLDTKKIVERFKAIHKDKYDYSKVVYTNAKAKVIIGCPIHGDFEQFVGNHIRGQGCPTCNLGWTNEKILEYISSVENADILYMDAIELRIIINQGKLPDILNTIVFAEDNDRENSIKALKQHLISELSNEEDETGQNEFERLLEDQGVIEVDGVGDFSEIEETVREDLPKQSLLSLREDYDDLHVLDTKLVSSCDEEAIKFLIEYKLRKLWNQVMNGEKDVIKLRMLSGGKYFNLLKKYFFDEFDAVVNYSPPKGYSFPYELNLMQKLTVNRLINNKSYGNWSGTGAGKTLSFIVSSRELDSKLTIVVGLNSTITQLAESINEVYPDSSVFTHYQMGFIFNRSKHNYLLLNYDKFQQGYSEELFQNLNEHNKIDFIVIDEVHNIKQRTPEQESKRRGALKRLIGRARKSNPELSVLGMSATPVINNLNEAKSLLQMISGKKYEDLETRRTLTNAINIFKQMTLNGLRYRPKYNINIKEITGAEDEVLRIDATDLLQDLLELNNQDYLGAERILLKPKLKRIKPFLRNGTIIYTYFTTKMVSPVLKHLKILGYKAYPFTGDQTIEEREEYKNKFISGEIDILVGSRPIGTGVDGLQKVCNRMIILSLPWTDSEYTQLKGRIYRQGSNFDQVEIIIPQVVISLEDRDWSWDLQRLSLIRNKRTLADAAVDGVIPSKKLPSPKTLFKKSQEALREWKDRVLSGDIFRIEREELKFPLNPEIVERLGRKLGDFSKVNRDWSTAKSSTTHNKLKEHPEDWYYYHTLYSEKRKSWDEIPYKEIAKKIVRKDFIVADLGCGEDLLRKEIPDNTVLSFDHIAINENVTACDISELPLKDQSVDVAVLSLALMGTNYLDYIKEAYRILRPMGFIFIAEPIKKWSGKEGLIEETMGNFGFSNLAKKADGNFLYVQGIKL